MKLKKAFTLAEAILTMTILGIIAAAMVTTLKPAQYKQHAFTLLKRKIYTNVDEVTQSIIADCTWNVSLSSIYTNCVKSTTYHAFGTNDNVLYAKYFRGATTATVGGTPTGCDSATTAYSSLKLKNGACLYFKAGEILVDVNGSEGPNGGDDIFTIVINNAEGVNSDMP